MSRLRTIPSILLVTLTMFAASGADSALDGQLRNRLRRAAQNAAEREVARQIDRTVTGMVRCALNDPSCIEEAKANGESVELTDEEGNLLTDANGNPISDPEYAEATRQKPGAGAWVNYDFVPGERSLFFEDYAGENVGDFPRRLEFLGGNMEVAESDGQRVLRATSGSTFAVSLGETLPERFTLEFPVHWSSGNLWMRVLFGGEEGMRVAPRGMGGYAYPHVLVDARSTGIKDLQGDSPESMSAAPRIHDGWVTIRVMADGEHAKVYVNEKRVANIPRVQMGRAARIWFVLADGSEERPIFLGPISVAAGGRDLYDRLAAEGTVVTRGILFDTDRADIRPESTPTLTEIGEMLEAHPDLRMGIVGHTDAQGDDQYNEDLSQRRADAVVRFLVDEFGVDANRLEAKGMGETAPVDSNDTPEGRANNRRVELTDLGAGGETVSGAAAPSPEVESAATTAQPAGAAPSHGTVTVELDGQSSTLPWITEFEVQR